MAINKFTGLEDSNEKPKINSFTGLSNPEVTNAPPRRSMASRGSSAGTFSDAERQTLNPGAFSNKAQAIEQRALAQDAGDKWQNGLAKAGVTFAGAFAENTLGIAAGLINVAKGESFSDTGLGRAIDQWNTDAQEAFPNYYTQREQESIDPFSVNFWADKVLNGVAYSAASIVSMALPAAPISNILKGGKFIRQASAISRAKTTSKGTIDAMSAGQRIKEVGEKVMTEGPNYLKQFGKAITRSGQKAETLLGSAIAESNVEARELGNHFKDEQIRRKIAEKRLDFKIANPNATENEISDIGLNSEEVASIIKNAKYAETANFLTNLAVVGSSNIAMFGRLVSGNSVSNVARKSTRNKVDFGTINKAARDKRNKLQVFADKVKGEEPLQGWEKLYIGVPKNSLSESAQEGLQFISKKTYGDYFGHRLNGDNADLAGSFTDAAVEAFTTNEGLESMLIGAIVGGGSTAGTSLGEMIKGEKNESEVKKLVDIINNPDFLGSMKVNRAELQNDLAFVMTKGLEEMETATAEGNNISFGKAYNMAKDAQIVQALQNNSFEALRAKLEDSKNMSDEDFAQFFDIEVDNIDNLNKEEVIDSVMEDLNKRKELFDIVEKKFGSADIDNTLADMLAKKITPDFYSEYQANEGLRNLRKEILYRHLSVSDWVTKEYEKLDENIKKKTELYGVNPKSSEGFMTGAVKKMAAESRANATDVLGKELTDEMFAEGLSDQQKVGLYFADFDMKKSMTASLKMMKKTNPESYTDMVAALNKVLGRVGSKKRKTIKLEEIQEVMNDEKFGKGASKNLLKAFETFSAYNNAMQQRSAAVADMMFEEEITSIMQLAVLEAEAEFDYSVLSDDVNSASIMAEYIKSREAQLQKLMETINGPTDIESIKRNFFTAEDSNIPFMDFKPDREYSQDIQGQKARAEDEVAHYESMLKLVEDVKEKKAKKAMEAQIKKKLKEAKEKLRATIKAENKTNQDNPVKIVGNPEFFAQNVLFDAVSKEAVTALRDLSEEEIFAGLSIRVEAYKNDKATKGDGSVSVERGIPGTDNGLYLYFGETRIGGIVHPNSYTIGGRLIDVENMDDLEALNPSFVKSDSTGKYPTSLGQTFQNSYSAMRTFATTLKEIGDTVSGEELKKSFKIKKSTTIDKFTQKDIDILNRESVTSFLIEGFNQFKYKFAEGLDEGIVLLTGSTPEGGKVFQLLKADGTFEIIDNEVYAKELKALDKNVAKKEGRLFNSSYVIVPGFNGKFVKIALDYPPLSEAEKTQIFGTITESVNGLEEWTDKEFQELKDKERPDLFNYEGDGRVFGTVTREGKEVNVYFGFDKFKNSQVSVTIGKKGESHHVKLNLHVKAGNLIYKKKIGPNNYIDISLDSMDKFIEYVNTRIQGLYETDVEKFADLNNLTFHGFKLDIMVSPEKGRLAALPSFNITLQSRSDSYRKYNDTKTKTEGEQGEAAAAAQAQGVHDLWKSLSKVANASKLDVREANSVVNQMDKMSVLDFLTQGYTNIQILEMLQRLLGVYEANNDGNVILEDLIEQYEAGVSVAPDLTRSVVPETPVELNELLSQLVAAPDTAIATPIIDNLFKILDQKKYEEWQETIPLEELQNELKELGIENAQSEEQAALIISQYLIPIFAAQQNPTVVPKTQAEQTIEKAKGFFAASNPNNAKPNESANSINQISDNVIDIDTAIQNISEILGDQFPVEIVRDIAKRLGLKNVSVSQFVNGIIKLDPNSPTGTEYHEAFHAVFRTFLDDEQITSALNAAKTKYGVPSKEQLAQFIADEPKSRSKLSSTQLTNLWFEEKMADDFKAYMKGKKAKPKGILGTIFEWLKNLFTGLKKNNKDEVETLFGSIAAGKFKNTSPKYNIFMREDAAPAYSLLRSTERVNEVTTAMPLTRELSANIINNIAQKTTKYVTELAIGNNPYTEEQKFDYAFARAIDEVKDLYIIEDELARAKGYNEGYQSKITRRLENDWNNELKAGTITDEQYNQIVMGMISNIRKVYEAIPRVYRDSKTKQLEIEGVAEKEMEHNLKVILKEVKQIVAVNILTIEDIVDEQEIDGQEQQKGEAYHKASYEEGGYDRVPDKLKAMIAMASVFNDEFNIGAAYLEEGKSLAETTTMSRYLRPVNTVYVYNSLIKILANTKKSEMMKKLSSYSESNMETAKFLEYITQRIADEVNKAPDQSNVTAQDIKEMTDETFEIYSQHSQTLNLLTKVGHGIKLPAVDILFDPNTQLYKVLSSDTKDIENSQLASWKAGFEKSTLTPTQLEALFNDIKVEFTAFDIKGNDIINSPILNERIFTQKLRSIRNMFDEAGIPLSLSYVKYSVLHYNENRIKDAIIKIEKEDGDSTILTNYLEYIDMYRDVMPINNNNALNKINFYSKKALDQDATIYDAIVEDVTSETKKDVADVNTSLKNIATGNAEFDESITPSSYTNMEDKMVQMYMSGFYISEMVDNIKRKDTNSMSNLLFGKDGLYTLFKDVKSISDLEPKILLLAIKNITDFALANNNAMPSNSHAIVAINTLINDGMFSQNEGGNAQTNFENTATHFKLLMFGGARNVVLEEQDDGQLNQNKTRSKGQVYHKLTSHDKMVMELVLFHQRRTLGSTTYNYVKLNVNADKRTQIGVQVPIINAIEKGKLSTEARAKLRGILKMEYDMIRFFSNPTTEMDDIEGFNDNISETDPEKNRAFRFHRMQHPAIQDELDLLITTAKEKDAKSFDQADEEFGIDAIIDKWVTAKTQDLENKLVDLNILFDNKGTIKVNTLPQEFTVGKELNNSALTDFVVGQFISTNSANNLLDMGSNYISVKSAVDEVKRNSGKYAQGSDMGEGNTFIEVFENQKRTIEESESARHKVTLPKNKTIDSTDAISYTDLNWYINTFLQAHGQLDKDVKGILRKLRRGTWLNDKDYDVLYKNKAVPQSLKLQINSAFVMGKMSTHIITRQNVSYTNNQDEVNRLYGEIENLEDLTRNKDTKKEIQRRLERIAELYTAIPGREDLHIELNIIQATGVGLRLSESASKRPVPLDTPIEIPNSIIRKQLETSGFKSNVLDGSQKLQIITSELAPDAEIIVGGKSYKAKEVQQMYRQMIAQRMKAGIQEKKQMMLDQFGRARYDLMFKEFLNTISLTGASPQIEELFKLTEDFVPEYDINFPSVVGKVEAMYLAMFDKGSIRNYVSGTKFSLVPDYGYNKLQLNGKSITTREFHALSLSDKVKVESAGRLKHRVKNSDGNYYSEVIVSESFAKSLGLKIGEEIPEEYAKMFGVRIPTQDKHSMISMKIVDYTDSSMGNMIVTPYEIIHLAGSDFDIDAMYARFLTGQKIGESMITYGNYLTKATTQQAAIALAKEEYLTYQMFHSPLIRDILDTKGIEKISTNFTRIEAIIEKEAAKKGANIKKFDPKQVIKNYKAFKAGNLSNIIPITKHEMSNLMLKMEIGMLHNEENIEIAATPATRDKFVKGAKLYKTLGIEINPPTEAVSSASMSSLDEANAIGGRNIGIAAQFNTAFQYFAGKEFQGDKTVFGENGFNVVIDKKTGIITVPGTGGKERVNDIISMLVTAMTDAAKHQDPATFNITRESLNVMAMAIGSGKSFEFAINLINQPAVKEYIRQSTFTGNKLTNQIVKSSEIEEKVLLKFNLKKQTNENFILTEKQLENQLILSNEALDPEIQYAALKQYIQAKKAGEQLAKFSKFSSMLSQGRGSNFIESMTNIEEAITAMKSDSYLFNMDEIFLEHPQLAALEEAYNAGITVGKEFFTMPNKFPMKIAKTMLNSLSAFNMESYDGMKQLFNALSAFMTTKAVKHNKKITAGEEVLFTDVLHVKIDQLRSMPHLRNNKFLKYLQLTPLTYDNGSLEGVTLYNISINTRRKEEGSTRKQFLDDFTSLFYSQSAEERELASMLIDFLMLKDGFQFVNGSFATVMEPSILKKIGLFEETNKILDLVRDTGNLNFTEVFGLTETEMVFHFVETFARGAKNKNLLNRITRKKLGFVRTEKGDPKFIFDEPFEGKPSIRMTSNISKKNAEDLKGLGFEMYNENQGSVIPFAFNPGNSSESMVLVEVELNGTPYDMRKLSEADMNKILSNNKIHADKAVYMSMGQLGSRSFFSGAFTPTELELIPSKYRKRKTKKDENPPGTAPASKEAPTVKAAPTGNSTELTAEEDAILEKNLAPLMVNNGFRITLQLAPKVENLTPVKFKDAITNVTKLKRIVEEFKKSGNMIDSIAYVINCK